LAGKVRAIVVVNPSLIGDGELKLMHQLGVRGVRINVEASGQMADIEEVKKRIKQTAERIAFLDGWMIQLYVQGEFWDRKSPSHIHYHLSNQSIHSC
jgi:hypothetical protein